MEGSRPAAIPWRRIVLPAEHGGWAFLAEPIVLGLLVAFSASGVLVALAAIAAFLARQPLKLLAGDRRKGKRYARTIAAERAFAVLATVAALALAGALATARGPLLVALGAAAPLAALALAFDLGRRPREAAGELAAALALGASAAAIALAAGWSVEYALGLWGILAARVVPSILYLRARLRRARGQPVSLIGPLLAQPLGIAWAALLAARGLAPWLGVAAIAVLALRAVINLLTRRRPTPPRRVGTAEIALGALTVVAVAVGTWLGI